MLSSLKQEFAKKLFDFGAAKFSVDGFRLKIHDELEQQGKPLPPLSPFYFNFRDTMKDNPVLAGIGADVICEIAADEISNNNLYASVSTGSLPSALLLGESFGKLVLTVEEGKGWKSIVNDSETRWGKYSVNGKKAMVIGDLITNARSKIEALKILQDSEIKVEALVVFLDRQQGGVAYLFKFGYSVYYAFTIGEVLEFYHAKNIIDSEMRTRCEQYVHDNQF